MRKFYANSDFGRNNLELDFDEIKSKDNNLFFSFTENGEKITLYSNLKFGFELKKNEEIVQYGVFPKPGIKYIQTDQEYLEIVRLNLEPKQNYTLYLWAENHSRKIENQFQFSTPVNS